MDRERGNFNHHDTSHVSVPEVESSSEQSLGGVMKLGENLPEVQDPQCVGA